MSSFGVRWRRLSLPISAILALMAIAGCGGAVKHTTTTVRTGTDAAASGGAATVRPSNGVPIPPDPARIVSLSPSATEDLYAIGAGQQVVAVDQYSTYPAAAPRTSMSAYQPNVEAIAKYRPDLVVTYEDVDNVVAVLGKLHIPVLLDLPPATLNGAYTELAELGAATGHQQRAAAVIATMRRQIAASAASVPRPTRPLTVYHELDQTYYSASSTSFIGQLYALLGLRNIADRAAKGSPYPQLSSEYVIASDPDLIVLADTVCCGQSARTVAARPGWNNIAAVKDRAVLAVNDSVASEWGPRIVFFLQTVANEVRRLEGAG
jgi:iron complex transport system substrate-binding protein